MRTSSDQIPSLLDGISFFLRSLAAGLDWASVRFSFLGTEAGATIAIGVAAGVIAVWAIISQRSIARRQATVDLILRLESDREVIEARQAFQTAAKSPGGIARYAADSPMTGKQKRAFRKDLTKLLQTELEISLAEELAAHISDGDHKMVGARLSKQLSKRVGEVISKQQESTKRWKKDKDAIRRVLNDYELISIGIHRGALDYKIYRHWNKSTTLRYYAEALPYITAIRSRYENDRYYCEFEALCRELSGIKPVTRRRYWALWV